MNKSSDDLFDLIKSMSAAEKRHFKLFGINMQFGKDSKNYLHLFDAINNQQHYDEELLKRKLNKIIRAGHFSNAKNYLVEALLNGLNDYYSGVSVVSQIETLIQKARILKDKTMLNMSLKFLKRAEKLAIEYDEYYHLLQINDIKVKITVMQEEGDKDGQALTKLLTDEQHYLQQIKQYFEYRNRVVQLKQLESLNPADQKKYLDENFEDIFNPSLLSVPYHQLSYPSFRNYNFLHCYKAVILKEQKKAIQSILLSISVLESEKSKLEERAEFYLNCLLSILILEFKPDEKIFKKANDFYLSLSDKRRTRLVTSTFIRVLVTYSSLLNRTQKYQQALKVISGISENEIIQKNGFDTKLVYWNLVAVSHLMLGNFKESMKFFNKIINLKTLHRLELQGKARCLSLLIHYELGNFESLPYLTKSAKSFLSKHGLYFDFEKAIISFFEKANKFAPDQSAEQLAFIRFKNELAAAKLEAGSVWLFGDFNFTNWAQSKIQNGDLLKKKKL